MNIETVLIVAYNMVKAQEVAKNVRNKEVYCKVYFHTEADRIDFEPVAVITVADDNGQVDYKTDKPVLNLDNLTNDNSIDEAIDNFLFKEAGCKGDWTVNRFIDSMVDSIKEQVKDERCICALSGGVDSSVCAALVSRAIGKNLTCVFVDTGLMRKDEGDEVEEMMSKFDMNFVRVEAQDRFLGKLKGVIEPEQKRKIIGEEFIRVFEDEAKKFKDATCFVQGTIYPDILESGIGGHLVKSHHNVGGMPEEMGFRELVEPLKELFKDEVRKVGIALGLPRDKVFRQPFPGPGLAVRCINEVNKEKLDILREADYIFRDEIAKEGLAESIWQYFAVMTDIKTVGVLNGKRTYGYTIALRAIHSLDAMNAQVAELSYPFLNRVSTRIIEEVCEVGRVVYDITSKPPGTIEFE